MADIDIDFIVEHMMIFFHPPTVKHTLKSMRKLYELIMNGGKSLAYVLRMMEVRILLVAIVPVIVWVQWSSIGLVN